MELADKYGAKQGLDRRQFLATSCGMAAAFVAMNDVFGHFYDMSEAEAPTRPGRRGAPSPDAATTAERHATSLPLESGDGGALCRHLSLQ